MNTVEVLKKRKILFIAIAGYIILFFHDQTTFQTALQFFAGYMREMLEILPAIFIITGLIDVWVSRETILNHFGTGSGIRGRFLALLIGSVSAGPIYAAFPVTRSLMSKGASLSNIVIILSAWAVVKIPMLLVEIKFLGLDFMGVRYVLTVPCIFIIGIAMEKLIKPEDMTMRKQEDDILIKITDILPGYNCGSCGHGTCSKYATAMSNGTSDRDRCVPGGNDVIRELGKLLD